MNEENKKALEYQIAVMQSAIDIMKTLLPDEQLQRGSELQQIDSLVLELAHKYIKVQL